MGLLDGKVALITGGGGGVGQGCAYAMAREGCAVVITGRTESKLKDTVGVIEGFGGRAIGLVADITQPEDVERTVAETVSAFGGLDIIVNNAISEVYIGPLIEAKIDVVIAEFNVGPIATLRYMQAVYPHMKARGGGVIINMVSGAMVRQDSQFYGVYSASKAAISRLSRAAACEWGPDNIRVLNVSPLAASPGWVEWAQNSPDELAALNRSIPLQRVGDPEKDVGRGVVALCSPLNHYLTGCTIPLDGGHNYFS